MFLDGFTLVAVAYPIDTIHKILERRNGKGVLGMQFLGKFIFI